MSEQRRGLLIGSLSALILATLTLFQNCGGGFDATTGSLSSLQSEVASCERVQPAAMLSQTCQKLVDDGLRSFSNLKLYEPQYPLYSDNATKRRWIYLPMNRQIDTTDPDGWIFPRGTILWKEFAYNGRRVETRQLEKIADGEGVTTWRTSVYIWRVDQTDADLLVGDFYADYAPADQARYEAAAVQASYSIVNSTQCMACHQGARDVGTGFSYLQLSHLGTRPDTTINYFSSSGFFTNPPRAFDQIPGGPAAASAIGYIQSNCATCHNPRGIAPLAANFLHLSTNLTLADENIIKNSAGGVNYVLPGNPDQSRVVIRMTANTMPPRNRVPLRMTDQQGLQTLRTWISALQ
ncbi:MAG: hypothetical protein AB7N80_07085 [Bdellovibrionales bacterium]